MNRLNRLTLAAMTLLLIAPAALLSQRKTIGTNPTAAEARNTDLVKILPPGRTGPRPPAIDHNRPAPKPLTVAEKQSLMKGLLASLQLQSKNLSARGLALVPTDSGTKSFSFSTPRTLSPKTPDVAGVGSLIFVRPEAVAADEQWSSAQWSATRPGSCLAAYVVASAGNTYVLDFAVGAGKMYVDASGSGSSIQLEMNPTQGHLLVPFAAPSAGTYTVILSADTDWVFYSVHIQTAN